jgi:nitric oxide reductase NorQ protein
MTTKLSNTSRLILRSRVRRHKDGDTATGGNAVSSISNADLVQIALTLGLDVPSDSDCALYDRNKAKGTSGNDAIAAADYMALHNGMGGTGMAYVSLLSIDKKGNDGPSDDAAHVDDDHGHGTVYGSNNADHTTQTADVEAGAPTADADNIKARANEKAKEIRGMFGAGDFQGFQNAIVSLAESAFRPDPAPVVQRVVASDPSKVKGTIPNVIGRKTVNEAKIQHAGVINDEATAMDVYNAADAPSIDEDYIWPDCAGSIVATLAHADNVMIYGPAGTGKTTLAEQVAARWGRPFVRISCDDQTEAATLTGMTVPDGKDGVKWQDGQLTAAIRRAGTVILIDEPSVARAGALFVLQAVLDSSSALHLGETGEVVPVAEGVIFILADNTNGTGDETGQYEATRRLNRAFLDRAAVTHRLDYMSKTDEAKALVKRAGCSKKIAATLATFAAKTRAKADDAALSHGVGFRRIMSLAKQLSYGVTPHAAFQSTVLETAPYDDREPLRQIWSAEVDTATLK